MCKLSVSECDFCNWVGSRSGLEADRDHLFSWVSVRLFGSHPSEIAVFTPAQMIRTKRGNELEFDSVEPNKTGVNTL